MLAVKSIISELLTGEALSLQKACSVFKLYGGIQQLLQYDFGTDAEKRT